MKAVFGSTGKVGGKVSAMLLESGTPVRVLVRSEEKAAPIRHSGAEVVIGSMLSQEDIERTLDRCDAAFFMTPGNYASDQYIDEELQIGRNYSGALKDSTIGHSVYLSVWKARERTGVPFMDSKAAIEDSLVSSGVNCTFLRPAMFMENLYWEMSNIRESGTISMPLPADLAMPWVAVEDIAYAAVESLRRGSRGRMETYEMLGPRDYSMSQITDIIGAAIGRPLRYQEMSMDEARRVFGAFGFSPSALNDYLAFFTALRTLKAEADRSRVYDEFNFEPTTFETFAATLAGVKVGAT